MTRLYVLCHGEETFVYDDVSGQRVYPKVPKELKLFLACEPGQTLAPDAAFDFLAKGSLPDRKRMFPDTAPTLRLTPLTGDLLDEARLEVAKYPGVATEILSNERSLGRLMQEKVTGGVTELVVLSCGASRSGKNEKIKGPRTAELSEQVDSIVRAAERESLGSAYQQWLASKDKDHLVTWAEVAVIKTAVEVRAIDPYQPGALWSAADLVWYSNSAAEIITGEKYSNYDTVNHFASEVRRALDHLISCCDLTTPAGVKEFWKGCIERKSQPSTQLVRYVNSSYTGGNYQAIRVRLSNRELRYAANEELRESAVKAKAKVHAQVEKEGGPVATMETEESAVPERKQKHNREVQPDAPAKKRKVRPTTPGAPYHETFRSGSDASLPVACATDYFALMSPVPLFQWGGGGVVYAHISSEQWTRVKAEAVELAVKPSEMQHFNSVYQVHLRCTGEDEDRVCWIGVTDSTIYTEVVGTVQYLHRIYCDVPV